MKWNAFTSIIIAFILLVPLSFAENGGKSMGMLDSFLQDVRKQVLPNGLTLITREAKGTGVVAINTWVKAGYFNEPDEVAGMAHLFEHMFFKGSKKFPGSEQIAEELASIGGQTNAGTIYDYTTYYFVVPRESFRKAVEIQADAVINPLFDEGELKKEAEVVIEESNRKLDNAPAVSYERMLAESFTQHRIKRWRIGSNEVLRNIRRDNLLAFFQTVYRPENMILSIAGDITHEEAGRVVSETFGALPKGEPDLKFGPKEPEQTEFRFGQSDADIKQGYSVLGWHTQGVGHPDEIALNVLARILGGGRSSRLYVNVVGPDSAATAEASHDTFGDVGVFSIQASFDEANRKTVDRKILQEVARIREHGPTGYELQLAKNSIESAIAFGLDEVLGQALTLSEYEARYGYRALSTRLAELNALTEKQVQDVAKKYLTNEKLTLYHYHPKSVEAINREQALALVEESTRTAPEALPETPLPAAPAVVKGASDDGTAQEMKLSNGITLIVKQRKGAPIITAGIFFSGGRLDENSRNAGITQLMTAAMRKGTQSRTGRQIDREIEFLGTQIRTAVMPDYFGMSIDILRKNFRDGLDLLSDVALHPTFPDDGVSEEKHLQLAAIKRAYDSSTQRPFEMINQVLYGSHPYALPANGFATSLETIGTGELKEWWNGHVRSNDAVAVVVGDIATDEAKALIETAFAKLSAGKIARTTPPEVVPPASQTEMIEYRDRKQSAIVYAFPTVSRKHEDWPEVRLIGNITSGLAGTLFAELRGRRSLAYTVFASQYTNNSAGAFMSYLATDAAKEGEARQALLSEVRRLAKDGFTDSDVARAKSYFAGSTRINLQTNNAQAADLITNRFADVGLDFTEKLISITNEITPDEVRAVANKYLTTDAFAGVVQKGKM